MLLDGLLDGGDQLVEAALRRYRDRFGKRCRAGGNRRQCHRENDEQRGNSDDVVHVSYLIPGCGGPRRERTPPAPLPAGPSAPGKRRSPAQCSPPSPSPPTPARPPPAP